MKLTKKQSIIRSIEHWEWLAETGSAWKHKWPRWEKYGATSEYCFLCEYGEQRELVGSSPDRCDYCPYYRKFGSCVSQHAPYNNWYFAHTPRERKEHAALFLAQLKELL